MTRRAYFAPLLSLSLLVMWLLLNGYAPGQFLLGTIIAIAIPALLRRRGAWHRWSAAWTAVRLFFTVLTDIVVSAIALARLILGPHDRIRPAFIRVPLQLRDPNAIVILASIITMTPGTLTVDVAEDRSHVLVHAFDLEDATAEIAHIKRRYEDPLMRVFGETPA